MASSSYNVVKIWKIDHRQYYNTHILKGHSDIILTVIELEDGKIASGSGNTIKIWDNNSDYQNVKTLRGNETIFCLFEIDDYIASGGRDDSVKIWNKYSYESIQTLQGTYCLGRNGFAKLNNNSLIAGGKNEIFIIDISSFQVQSFKSKALGEIWSIFVLRNGVALIGNWKGTIHCFDSSSGQITFTRNLHESGISYLIKNEGKILSSSHDGSINVCECSI